jgi:enoyl-CoA hydratase
MEFETIAVETRNAVAWIRLNRAKVMNALSPQLVDELNNALEHITTDDGLRVVVITGSGAAFCAGADLAFARGSLEQGDAGPMLAFLERVGVVFGRLARFPKPVIAALNGLALAGGLELALCCDLVLAAESARIGDAHANYGLLPGGGATVRLPQRIGMTRAKYLLFTGDFVPASELVAAGLVNRVVADAALEAETQALAERISMKSPLGLRRMKEVVADAAEQPDECGLRLERLALAAHLHSEDLREGLRAFSEKRSPVFRGR